MPIHPTAVVDPNAQIDPTAEIGPFASIGPNVTIGARTQVMSHAFLEGHTTIGEDNKIYPGAVIGTPPQHLGWAGAPTYTVIGDRNTFREYVTIHGSYVQGGRTLIGNDNYLMANAHVGHDSVVGHNVTIANASMLGGHVEVQDRCFISGLVGVHQFCRVGRLVMIAGVARITRDVPPYMMAYGDSEVIGINLVGLRRAGISAASQAEIKKAYRVLYDERRSLPAALKILKAVPRSPEVQHLIAFLESSKRGICGGLRSSRKGEAPPEPSDAKVI